MTAPVGRAPSKSQNVGITSVVRHVHLRIIFLQSPGRSEAIDVDKLNQLIRAVDKTWIFPRLGAKEPVGSNFQVRQLDML